MMMIRTFAHHLLIVRKVSIPYKTCVAHHTDSLQSLLLENFTLSLGNICYLHTGKFLVLFRNNQL